jgi:hypothetical protein
MRPLALVLCGALAACDPVQSFGIVVAPQPVLSDSSRNRAFALAALVARSHGLSTAPDNARAEGWQQCYAKAGKSFTLCGRSTDREVQFQLFEALSGRLSPVADTVRREVTDSLRAQFGAQSVRECRWSEHPDRNRAGCPQ